MLEVDAERLVAMMNEQAEFGRTDTPNELNRVAPSESHWAVTEWFRELLEAEGMETWLDEIGNLFGRREGTDPEAEPVLIGSHLDSHRYGGIYDGNLGVIAALETVRSLNEENIETRRPIEVVSWFNEEASRYEPGLMGSSVWAGRLDLEDMYARTDRNEKPLREALDEHGYVGDVPAEPQRAYEAYLELHIQQGPSLLEAGADVGVVTGVIGRTNGELTFTGVTDHAGGTPMHHRQDTLVAAADVITQVRRIPRTLGDRTVGTVGEIQVEPGNRNAIPGETWMTWEFRDPDDHVVAAAYDRLVTEAESAAAREGVQVDVVEISRSESARSSPRCIDAVSRAAESLGYDCSEVFSGGGHDAQVVSTVCDAGMIFAVNESGRSHTAEEYTGWDHCVTGANTLANATLELAG